MNFIALGKDFLSLIYPPVCEACSGKLFAGESLLCTKCWNDLPLTGFHKDMENPLTRLFWGRADIMTGTALFYYHKGGMVQKVIHRLKYKGGTKLGYYLGCQLGNQLKDCKWYDHLDVIVAVPLHKERLRSRGFNQSEVIGMGLSSTMGIPLNNKWLQRISATQSQTKKRRFLRWQNVETVFQLTPGSMIEGRHILLVDDVITTGATLEACATRLTEKGASVWIATIGVTV